MSGIVVLILRILLVVALYGFLSWAVIIIWRDLRSQGQLISSPVLPSIGLVPFGQTEPKTFSSFEITLGRSGNSDYPLSDETVSSRHARLSYRQNQWWIEDLGSTNGTFLNDERVNVPTVIVTGDELRIGQVSLAIVIEEKKR
jgi:pSer/pThr/pTyr-binding forkhead associated (FHA) protein